MSTSEMMIDRAAARQIEDSEGVVRIPQVDPGAFYRLHRDEVTAAMRRVVESGWYILGDEVRAFEREFSHSVGTAHGVGVASGTDAVALGLRALGVSKDDYVATVSHTAVATVAAIRMLGAWPVFVDIPSNGYLLEASRLAAVLRAGPKVKAVVVVHLYGEVADVPAICAVAHRYGARVLEDCAQAHGAWLGPKAAGSMGAVGSFSFYPTKNLGALGDAGMLVTNDPSVAAEARMLREYGWKQRYVSHTSGYNSRLDEVQAALLRLRLPYLAASNERRARIAAAYHLGLRGTSLGLPDPPAGQVHAYHQYVVRHPERDRLCRELAEAGIQTNVHYPVPVHRQPAYSDCCALPAEGLPNTEALASEVFSLPMYPELPDAAVERVINILCALLA